MICGLRSLALRNLLVLALGACAAFASEAGQPAYDLREHYTKYEVQIPMRDGTRLFTAIYAPKDDSAAYPFLIVRTPYSIGHYGVDDYPSSVGPSDLFMKSGYIFVSQDVRGRGLSEGEFINERPHKVSKLTSADIDESTDTFDTVEWLLHHVPGNNGKAGLWGVSYPGFYAEAGMIDSHPAIKAASPQAPMADVYLGDDFYRGGALLLSKNFDFLRGLKPRVGLGTKTKVPDGFSYGTQDGYEYFLKMGPLSNAAPRMGTNPAYWQELMDHPTYDAFWQERAIWHHLSNIHCPVLTVGGWFDAEDLMGTLRTYHSVREANPQVPTTLVMGPWVHGGWTHRDGHRLGNVDFGSDTGKFYNERIVFPFFEHYLKGGADAALPGAWVFETGTNQWRRYPSWPPPGAAPRTLYLRAQGSLSLDGTDTSPGQDSYVSDPRKPVPFVGYAALGMPQEYMVADQRFASSRPDVLVYQTEPLDRDVTVSGPVAPSLYVSSSGTDSDWVVKLIDVYPPDLPTATTAQTPPINDVPPPTTAMAGYQQLVRGEPFRAKYRKSMQTPEPLVPGKVERLEFTLPDINHTFRRGHRIMVQIQSTWFPLFDLNPQTFTTIPTAKPEDFKAATETVYRGPATPSGVKLYILDPLPVR